MEDVQRPVSEPEPELESKSESEPVEEESGQKHWAKGRNKK